MDRNLENQAIGVALAQNWKKAIEINKKIIKDNSQNIPALNRLAHCHWELGDIEQALKNYKKVLKIDNFNPIANKNITRLSKSGKIKKNLNKKRSPFSSKIFLEEPGKTKIVSLVRLAEPDVLGKLNNGEKVIMVAKKRLVSIQNEEGNYLGTIPEDLSLKLIKFMNGGNQYDVFVKNIDHQTLHVFIREISRGGEYNDVASFN